MSKDLIKRLEERLQAGDFHPHLKDDVYDLINAYRALRLANTDTALADYLYDEVIGRAKPVPCSVRVLARDLRAWRDAEVEKDTRVLHALQTIRDALR